MKKSRPAHGWANRSMLVQLNVVVIVGLAAILGMVFNPLVIAPTQARPGQASNFSSFNEKNNSNAIAGNSNIRLVKANNGGTNFISGSAPVYNISVNPSQSAVSSANDLAPHPTEPTEINGQQFEYFNSTGHSVSGPLLHFYQQTGGMARHGAPLTEIVAVNNHYWQFFQNSVMEFDPRYLGTTSEAKLIPLGQQEAAHYDFAPVTPFTNTVSRWYFPESGHTLSAGFLDYWLNNGDRASLGLPLSEEIQTQDTAGQSVTIQYLQYVRLEYRSHPADPSQSIQISPLGQEVAVNVLTPAKLSPVALNLLTAARHVRIPSLMFHYIRLVEAQKDPLGFGLSVTPDNFVSYLDYLQSHGFHTVTVAQIYDYLRYGIALPDKPINLRFDDGYLSHWFAYQQLYKRGMTATFFVITRHLELTPQQWQQIDHDGFEVAAHTRTHPDLKGVNDLVGEITGSKTDLEAMLGHPVRTFAFPYGSYNPNVVRVVKASGFDVSVSTNGGVDWNLAAALLEPTLGITGRDTLNTFAAKAELSLPDLNANYSPANSSSDGSAATTTTKPAPTKSTGGNVNNTVKPTATPISANKSQPTSTAKPTPKPTARPTIKK